MQCTRNGCSRQLRVDNKKGVCSYNCESPDAPAAARAVNVKASTSTSAKKIDAPAEEVAVDHAAVLAKFRTVAEALGFDPEEQLAAAAENWMQAAGAAVKAADDAATDEDEG